MKLILRYLRRHGGIFLVSTFALTMEALCDLAQPAAMASIVDRGVSGADLSLILRYGLSMLAIAGLGAVFAALRSFFASRTSQAVAKEIRSDMYRHVQSLSLENIDHLQSASIITRVTNDVTQIQRFVNSIMRMMVKAPITCVGAIVLMIAQMPRQAPLIALILLLSFLIILVIMKIGYPRFFAVQKALDRLNTVSREFLSSVRVVKAFCAEEEETEKFSDASASLVRANTSAMRTLAISSPLINLTVNFGIVLLLWTSRSQEGSQIGRLMASVNYMTQMLFSLVRAGFILNIAVRAMASSERIGEVLSEKPTQSSPSLPVSPSSRATVEASHVSFSYAKAGKRALEDVCFSALPGESLGIIGPTGSGKSTLVNLVPRFYDVSEGRILVSGVDVRSLSLPLLRTLVAVVPQKAVLFTGTVMENLRWGRSDATEEEVQRASRASCADIFIREMERGYDSLLGQGGVNLSGGQKQRLAIARALIRRPKILLLDDCTSALDARTEEGVLSNLRAFSSTMTILIVSQRISTVMKSERILCLEDGKVRGYGSHAFLLESCPCYQAINASQRGGSAHVG